MALENIVNGTISELVSTNPTSNDSRSEGDNHLRNTKDVLKRQFPGASGSGYNKTIIATEDELNALEDLDTSTTLEQRLQSLSGGVVGASFPSGTRLLFAQNSAPDGWFVATDDKAYNRMIRVVNSAASGNSTGGYDSPIECNKVASHTHNVSLSSSGSHTHSGNTGNKDHGHGSRSSNNAGNHSHSGSTKSAGNHSHSQGGKSIDGSGRLECNGGCWGTPSQKNTGTAGSHTHSLKINSGGSHSHSTTISTGTGGNHNHSISVSGGNHTHSGTTNTNSGSSNWKPRYLSVLICQRS